MSGNVELISEQTLRSATTIAIHKYHLLKTNKENVLLFIEGEDDVVYYPLKARTIIDNKQIIPLNCGGKLGVIQVAQLTTIDRKTKKYSIGYFVDTDFDYLDSINECIYTTPTYSVENLVYNLNTFKNILTTMFNITPADPSFDKIIEFYQKRRDEYFSAMQLYNTWIYIQRTKYRTSNVESLKLTKKIPDGFISFSFNKIQANYSLDSIKALHPTAPIITEEDIENHISLLPATSGEEKFRGKFSWEFFAFIISSLIEDANNDKKRILVPKKVKFNITKKDGRKLFEEISPFSPIPICLKKYITSLHATS